MPPTCSVRLSVPLHGARPALTEADLRLHSIELMLLPRVLAALPPRVRVDWLAGDGHHTQLLAAYIHPDGTKAPSQYLRLVADPDGVLTDSDALYGAIHAAAAARAPHLVYLGFTRWGRPPYAPLFALALLIQKYGRGIVPAGACLPVPWDGITVRYARRV